MIYKLQKKNSISNKKKIYVAGHNGLVGSSIYKYLKKKKLQNICSIKKRVRFKGF